MSVRQGSSIIAIGNVAVDGDTTSFNANNSLQANGVINKNTAVGATEKIYDWVGTLAEYTAQDIATNHPDWLCFITDDDASELLDTAWGSTLALPDFEHYDSLTILASGNTYTAPANGWFYAKGQTSTAGATGVIYLHGPLIGGRQTTIGAWAPSGAAGRVACCIYPVTKGTTVEFVYGNSTTNLMLAFIYACGEGQ